MQLGSQPVAVVHYTYTHKQYRERHKTINTLNNTKIHRTTQKLGRVRAVPPSLRTSRTKSYDNFLSLSRKSEIVDPRYRDSLLPHPSQFRNHSTIRHYRY